MTRLKTLTAAIALLSGVAAANAADLSTKDSPAFNPFGSMGSGSWTGFYLGINGGYGWDSALSFNDAYAIGKTSLAAFKTDTRPEGWFYGLSAGADWQFSGIVLGVETDIDMSNIGDDSAVKCVSGIACPALKALGTPTTAHSTIDWFGTLRARAGIPVTTGVLLYGTGGLAYGGVSNRSVTALTNLAGDDTKFGWAAGAGVEYKISPGWSVKTEWLHIDLGSTSLGGAIPVIAPPSTTSSSNSQHNEVDLVKFGLVYKLGSDYTHPVQ